MEKTFEELIDLEELTFTDIDGDYFRGLDTESVLKLLKQVREATIAECKEKTWQAKYLADAYNLIGDLPTDRIKK